VQFDNLEAVVEILPEVAVGNPVGKIAVGGGNDTCIHRPALVLTDSTDFPLLKHAQQLDLHASRDLTYLVEQQCSPAGCFK
jgi:hypothetical protein